METLSTIILMGPIVFGLLAFCYGANQKHKKRQRLIKEINGIKFYSIE